MRANNALALVFSNSSDGKLPELTASRSMASIPFGGRYRIIDFHLSALVNAGVGTIGIVPRANYRSLMDHIGAGKPWDLDRKYGGLTFLTPYITGSTQGVYKGHVNAIQNARGFIENCREEYIIITDCDFVCNIDIAKMFEKHIESGADCTVAYKHGNLPSYEKEHLALVLDGEDVAKEVLLISQEGKECDFCIGTVIFKKDKLLELVTEAAEHALFSISRGILQRNQGNLKIVGFEVEGFSTPIDGIEAYVNANMALLNPEIRRELFGSGRPIYTKTRDDGPTKYGLNCNVKNSLIADGCTIEGNVENCIIFRGVKIGKGTTVKDSIIMQSTSIGDNCDIQYVTTDKDVKISEGSKLKGAKSHHYIIKKGEKI